MNTVEITNQYHILENELEEIANSVGMSAKDLTREFNTQSEAIKNRIRPILWKQLEYLQEMLSYRYKQFDNVSVFPIPRLRKHK